MYRTREEIGVAQDAIHSMIMYCVRNKKKSLTISEMKKTIEILEKDKWCV